MKVPLDVFNHSLVTLGFQEQIDVLNEKVSVYPCGDGLWLFEITQIPKV